MEFRSPGWLKEDDRGRTLDLLRELGLALVVVDAPASSGLQTVLDVTNSDLAVVRFHGRADSTWKARDVTAAERFRYLYSAKELEEWVPRARELARSASTGPPPHEQLLPGLRRTQRRRAGGNVGRRRLGRSRPAKWIEIPRRSRPSASGRAEAIDSQHICRAVRKQRGTVSERVGDELSDTAGGFCSRRSSSLRSYTNAGSVPAATLRATKLRRERSGQLVLNDISLTVAPGDRIGVVGPNGVGKTTLLRTLAGLEVPDGGTVEVSPPGAKVGYLTQERER